jgi:hypothetical protein
MRFTAWSPSRLDDYETCPLRAKLKHLDKLCPLCHKGRVLGGFDTPAICDTCKKEIVKGPALERGSEIGDRLDKYLSGGATKPGPTIKHPEVLKIVKQARADIKAGKAAIQFNLALTRKWEVWQGPGWAPEVWLRARLDYCRDEGDTAHVIDWKTGGIDKRTGEVRGSEKYEDQLALYNVVTLCAKPKVKKVSSALCFLDTGPEHSPLVQLKGLERGQLAAAKQHFEKKTKAMLSDTTFAPRANGMCRFCEFSKGRGGPCKF